MVIAYNVSMKTEYSKKLIKSGVRGKYVENIKEGINVVIIDPDLRKFFPDSEAVNRALREYMAQKR